MGEGGRGVLLLERAGLDAAAAVADAEALYEAGVLHLFAVAAHAEVAAVKDG